MSLRTVKFGEVGCFSFPYINKAAFQLHVHTVNFGGVGCFFFSRHHKAAIQLHVPTVNFGGVGCFSFLDIIRQCFNLKCLLLTLEEQVDTIKQCFNLMYQSSSKT